MSLDDNVSCHKNSFMLNKALVLQPIWMFKVAEADISKLLYSCFSEVVLVKNSQSSSNGNTTKKAGNLSTVQKFKRSLQHSFSKLGKKQKSLFPWGFI